MKLTILRNDAQVPAGHIERVARDRALDVDLVRLDAGDDVPSVDSVDAVVVLGGEMGAYDVDRFPYLAAEKQFLVDAVDAGVPVLGVCLGCQLLADALGGRAYPGERPEVHFGPLDPVSPDPVVDALIDGPTLSMHQDTWDPPDGATVLARTDRYPQAFRYGSSLGIQPHPEVDSAIVKSWLTHGAGVAVAVRAGADPEAVMDDFTARDDEVAAVADRFFGAWIDEAELRTGDTGGSP